MDLLYMPADTHSRSQPMTQSCAPTSVHNDPKSQDKSNSRTLSFYGVCSVTLSVSVHAGTRIGEAPDIKPIVGTNVG
jgi:hypothetical protein